MATVNRRITASIAGDFVVFIIGARLNRWWKLPRYLWFFAAMPKMLAEVAADPRSGDVGIWHETFLVRAGEYACIYNNMRLRGLAKAAQHIDATGAAHTATGRLGRRDDGDVADATTHGG
jgi:hypothetical protein